MSDITRYEVVARNAAGATWLVGYTPRLSRAGLIAATRNVGGKVVEMLGIGDADSLDFGRSPRWHMVGAKGWIGFTGRTQLDARREGEHPFIARA